MAITTWRRDITSDLSGASATFSSWDKCMQKAYCKWPAIVGIILGSLIVLSLLRCCNSCCPSGRRKGYKSAAAPPPPMPPYQQYQSAPPPIYAAGAPQYAQFDAHGGAKDGGKFNEDALPAMPSWDTATSRKVEHPVEEGDDVELNHLDPNGNSSSAHAPMLANAAAAPLRSPALASPGFPHQQNGTMSGGDLRSSGYGQETGVYSATGHSYPSGQGYGQAAQYGQSSHYARGQSYNGHDYPQSHYPTQYTPSTIYEPTTANQGARQYPRSPYQQQPQSPYQPRSVPPSYRSAPSVASAHIGRKPVQGSWRDL
ncbi:hypothetical protein B0A49_06312 [Cryomyces minteri]|uniref:Uncharacterized protein n=1 Tax=Cryomyces minteri TaxID=331657 RepID=A0A4U0WX43_9PEZI|nr:hypothetical protein B0A49_06312 [Cryomyces minteri]